MYIRKNLNDTFIPVHEHVLHTYDQVICSGAATLVIHNDEIVLEKYVGHQSNEANARAIQEDTQFHVASVRKSYIGFAAAYAIYHGKIEMDAPVLEYLPERDPLLWKGTTVRHLLNHTHGLNEKEGAVFRAHAPGEDWAYKGTGLKALTEIIERRTGKSIADILHSQVFEPLAFHSSGWYIEKKERLVDVILRQEADGEWEVSDSVKGDQKNMYVSARELAFWGYFHMKKGNIDGHQIVPEAIIDIATSLQSPPNLDPDLPQNGCLWFVKDRPARKTEIGPKVPRGSYQILGYTGVTLLVVPDENLVAVRMFNSFGSPEGYDYLEDVRSFGDTVVGCVQREFVR
ncbi:serine hydrolase domain-containing protein [Thalassobacillus hwangdonensis]|uniref:Serine hydrolase domain-containing protein n=1 Tax=Thalassobacillus hwangdonensis TaxID=546108 RepID=A0ABW3L4G0_9BACI